LANHSDVYDTETPTFKQLAKWAGQNFNLQALMCSDVDPPTSEELQQLLNSCTSLTTLKMGTVLGHEQIVTLLRHGTHITTLSAGFEPKSSLANEPCRWRDVELNGYGSPALFSLVYLPLHSVEVLSMEGGLGSINLPLTLVPTEQVPAMLHRAATVISQTKSWQQKPPQQLSFAAIGERGPVKPKFTAQTNIQLFRALAPLKHSSLTKLIMEGFAYVGTFELGQPELAALSSSLGSHLQSIALGGYGTIVLTPSFWPALLKEFPGLQELRLVGRVFGAVGQDAIFAFCKEVTRPFTLVMDDMVCRAAVRQRLQSQLAALPPPGNRVVIKDERAALMDWARAHAQGVMA
jgi:hypothetical protein